MVGSGIQKSLIWDYHQAGRRREEDGKVVGTVRQLRKEDPGLKSVPENGNLDILEENSDELGEEYWTKFVKNDLEKESGPRMSVQGIGNVVREVGHKEEGGGRREGRKEGSPVTV